MVFPNNHHRIACVQEPADKSTCRPHRNTAVYGHRLQLHRWSHLAHALRAVNVSVCVCTSLLLFTPPRRPPIHHKNHCCAARVRVEPFLRFVCAQFLRHFFFYFPSQRSGAIWNLVDYKISTPLPLHFSGENGETVRNSQALSIISRWKRSRCCASITAQRTSRAKAAAEEAEAAAAAATRKITSFFGAGVLFCLHGPAPLVE